MNNLSRLIFAYLKRDLILNIIWILVLVSMVAAGLYKLEDLYGNSSSVVKLIEMFKTPMMTIMFCKIPDLNHYNIAIAYGAVMLPLMGALGSVMGIQIGVKGTRMAEANGSTELMLSKAIKRRVPEISSFIEVILVSVVTTILIFLCLAFANMKGQNIKSAFAFSAIIGAFIFMFGGLAILVSQIFSDVRTVNATCYFILGIAYFFRSVIDVKNFDSLRIFSPFNWLESMHVYYDLNLQYLILPLFSGVIFSVVGIYLVGKRDINTGFINEKNRGRKKASFALKGFITIFIRNERKTIFFWLVGVELLAVMYGGLSNSLSTLANGNKNMLLILGVSANTAKRELFQQFSIMAILMIVFFSIFAALVVLYREEKDAKSGAFDSLLSKPVSHKKVYFTYVFGSLISGVLIYTITYLSLFASISRKHLSMAFIFKGYLSYLCVLIVFVLIGALIISAIPSFYPFLYFYLSIMFLLTIMKDLFKVPLWFLKISPFGWMKGAPLSKVSNPVYISFFIISVVCVVIGLYRYKRRDLV
ncbi:MAG: hypothetical protein LBM02_04030 [Lachnospiraceae bacterium]|jgi:ABC-2 type transport system permease protein|nr:hypothetical protein [Lachnospiraceae bacterium]